MKPKYTYHIAVNTRFLLKDKLEGMGRFSYEILKRIVIEHPEVKFSFLFDRNFDEEFVFAENVEPYVLFPPARHPFLFIWYFEWALKRKLNQLKPDLFFSPDGFLSLGSPIPQVPVFHDLAFLHRPQDVSLLVRGYYHTFFPKFSKKAEHIIAVSEFTKSDIHKQFSTPLTDISVVYNAASQRFRPHSPEEDRKIREKLTAGRPYFLYVGAMHPRKNVNSVIRAFDLFKTNSTSPHTLLIVGRKAWSAIEIEKAYNESNFKEDILFTGFVTQGELYKIYSAAEALCYVPFFEGFGMPILEAMQSGTAVICSNVSSMPEVAGGAAVLVNPNSPSEIADGMKSIVSSVKLRENLRKEGLKRSSFFSWENNARTCWNVLEKTLTTLSAR